MEGRWVVLGSQEAVLGQESPQLGIEVAALGVIEAPLLVPEVPGEGEAVLGGDRIVALGTYDPRGGIFAADRLLVKCPSKYTGEKQQ